MAKFSSARRFAASVCGIFRRGLSGSQDNTVLHNAGRNNVRQGPLGSYDLFKEVKINKLYEA